MYTVYYFVLKIAILFLIAIASSIKVLHIGYGRCHERIHWNYLTWTSLKKGI